MSDLQIYRISSWDTPSVAKQEIGEQVTPVHALDKQVQHVANV